jgi:hypothetical protein
VGWLLDTFERIGGHDAKAARAAQNDLTAILGNSICYLLDFALRDQETMAQQLAGELLATLRTSLEKHHEKLSKTNSAYLKEKKKLGKLRTNVLFPKAVGQIVQRELKKAERHRRRLFLLKGVYGGRWKKIAQRNGISQEYFVTVNLPDFSVKSEPQWWDFLKPFISKKINVPELDSRYQMARKRYASDSSTTARDHLKLLARRIDQGIL